MEWEGRREEEEGARVSKEKREGGKGKKGSRKGILAIPILLCFRRRCTRSPAGAHTGK